MTNGISTGFDKYPWMYARMALYVVVLGFGVLYGETKLWRDSLCHCKTGCGGMNCASNYVGRGNFCYGYFDNHTNVIWSGVAGECAVIPTNAVYSRVWHCDGWRGKGAITGDVYQALCGCYSTCGPVAAVYQTDAVPTYWWGYQNACGGVNTNNGTLVTVPREFQTGQYYDCGSGCGRLAFSFTYGAPWLSGSCRGGWVCDWATTNAFSLRVEIAVNNGCTNGHANLTMFEPVGGHAIWVGTNDTVSLTGTFYRVNVYYFPFDEFTPEYHVW